MCFGAIKEKENPGTWYGAVPRYASTIFYIIRSRCPLRRLSRRIVACILATCPLIEIYWTELLTVYIEMIDYIVTSIYNWSVRLRVLSNAKNWKERNRDGFVIKFLLYSNLKVAPYIFHYYYRYMQKLLKPSSIERIFLYFNRTFFL